MILTWSQFIDLGIYTDAILDQYRGKNRLECPPHVFAIAESSYYNMRAYNENQCVIISGESGAGKTEAAKRIMQYIAAVSGGEDSSIKEIKDMVLATNPLLESFGCAKTLRNNNSSRHVCSPRTSHCRLISMSHHIPRASTLRSCSIITANPSAHESPTIYWKRVALSANSIMNVISISSTNSRKLHRMSNEVRHFYSLPSQLITFQELT